jgi:ribulose-phosphate 3-epimerase
VRRAFPNVYLDTHLMIAQPQRYAEAFVVAGASNLTFHVETVQDPAETARQIARLGCHVGITLNPATPVETIYPALDHINVVLVMSVVPGFSGQQFMPEVLDKCRVIKPRLQADQRLEIDGGIKPENIAQARAAGVDWFVAASAVFGAKDRARAIADLRRNLAT